MDRIRVLIIDGQRVFAQTLAAYLSEQPDFVVVGTEVDEAHGVAAVVASRPDVVLVDVEVSGSRLSDLLLRLMSARPTVRLVVLTDVANRGRVIDAVRAGVRGWVSKEAPGKHLLRVLRGAASGESWIPPQLLTEVLDDLVDSARGPGTVGPLRVLTSREKQILQRMVDGMTRAEVAASLFLSSNTVRTHTQNVLRKLGAHSGLEAVSVALRSGMRPAVDLSDDRSALTHST